LGAVAHEVQVERAAPPQRRASRAPVIVGVLVVLALIAGVVALIAKPDKANDPTSAAKGRQPSHTAAGSAGSAGSVPDGWASHKGDGWSVAVPSSYQATTFGGFPQYKDTSTGRTLRVSMTASGGGKADAVQDRRDQAASFARSHDGYRELSIAKADYRGLEAADWEFTYASGGAVLHALSRVFVIDGRGYSLYFQTRSTDDWSDALDDFDKIAASFKA
ncbi:MAG TPA: hypothetical protein VM347_16885, partial [Nonomuraea sp.]|nr:hypothetical protein [Nonomuraea sp.]